MTLNRGLYSLIHVHSSWRASTSVSTTVHSTEFAVWTIVEVRGCSWADCGGSSPSRRRSPAGRGPGTCRPRPRWGSTPWPDGSWRVLAFGSGLEHRFEESTGVRCGHLGDLLGCALGDDLAAAATAFGP